MKTLLHNNKSKIKMTIIQSSILEKELNNYLNDYLIKNHDSLVVKTINDYISKNYNNLGELSQEDIKNNKDKRSYLQETDLEGVKLRSDNLEGAILNNNIKNNK